MKTSLVWAAVALALGSLAGLVVLVLLHADVVAYMGAVELLVLPILGGWVATQLQEIKGQTNGTLSSLLASNQEHARMLAAAHVPTAAILAPAGPVQEPPAGGPSVSQEPDPAPGP